MRTTQKSTSVIIRRDDNGVQRMNATKQNSRRQRALADALAGVIASLVSLWSFYPIETLKDEYSSQSHSRRRRACIEESQSRLFTRHLLPFATFTFIHGYRLDLTMATIHNTAIGTVGSRSHAQYMLDTTARCSFHQTTNWFQS